MMSFGINNKFSIKPKMSKIRVNLNGIVKEMDTDKMEQMQTANGDWHYVVTDDNGCLTILTPKVR